MPMPERFGVGVTQEVRLRVAVSCQNLVDATLQLVNGIEVCGLVRMRLQAGVLLAYKYSHPTTVNGCGVGVTQDPSLP